MADKLQIFIGDKLIAESEGISQEATPFEEQNLFPPNMFRLIKVEGCKYTFQNDDLNVITVEVDKETKKLLDGKLFLDCYYDLEYTLGEEIKPQK